MNANFSELKGKTVVSIDGMVKGSELVTIICDDGSEYLMQHISDCCEDVRVEDVCGDVSDLIGSGVIQAEENSSSDQLECKPINDSYGTFTWTFYRIATAKGQVVIRWLGESNGYYSERVDFSRSK
jgi:hypothetical protein